MSLVFDAFDELQLYWGDDYVINDKIKIRQPTVGEIVRFGEHKYFSAMATIAAIPSDMKSYLWDNGIDWMEISDFDFFSLLAPSLPQEDTSIVFGDLNFQKMTRFMNQENGEVVLGDREAGVVIDRLIYQKMVDYIRKMNNIEPKIEKAANIHTKNFLIDLDRQEKARQKNEKKKSYLQPLISTTVNSAGFKYKKKELDDVQIVEFMDSVQRIQVIVSSTALLQGSYSGMIDTKKIDQKEFNIFREIVTKKKSGIELNGGKVS